MIFHTLYDKKEIFVKNILDPMNMTNHSRKNFADIKKRERLDSVMIENRINEFAKNADNKNPKNKGLERKLYFELEDHRIL